MDLVYLIGADTTNFTTNIKGLAVTAKTVGDEVIISVEKAGKATEKLGSSAISSSMKFMQMRSGLSALRDGTLAFAVGGQRADMMLMAMGHHINSLVNETGSLGGAMKALGQSAFGVGGAILAITVAYEIYQHTTKKAKEETVDFVKTLDSVRQAQLKGQQDGQSEITRLQILYKATQDHTLSLADRNKAYDELEKKYPKWFTNAERESTLLGQNKTKYDDLTIAILAAANAKAYENQIGINSNRAFENDQKITSELTEQAKQRKIIAQEKRAQELSTSGREGTGGGQSMAESRAVDAIGESIKKVNDLKTDSKKLNEQNLQLAKKAADFEKAAGYKTGPEESGKGSKTKEALDGLAKLQKELREAETALSNSILAGKTSSEDATSPLVRRVNAATEAIRKFNAEMDEVKAGIGAHNFTLQDSVNKVKPSTQGDTFGNGAADLVSMNAQIAAFRKLADLKISSRALTKEYNKELKEEAAAGKEIVRVFGQGLMGAFESALSGTSSFISAMGQFLTQLIEKLIAAAAAAAILAALLSVTGFASLGNFSSIFGALSGLGNLGKVASSGGTSTGPGISSFATGGIFTQAHAGVFGEAGPEAIVTPQHLQDFAGISGNNGNGMHVTFDPIMTGPILNYKARVRSDKYIKRTS